MTDATLTDDELAEIAADYDVDLDEVEVPEPPERVDVSDYKTAAGAAKATHAALQEWAEFYGSDPEAVVLYNPDETADKRDMGRGVDAWTVAWEGGPFEWAPALTGGESFQWNEWPGATGDPEVSGLLDGAGFDVECYYSFDIQFFNTEGY